MYKKTTATMITVLMMLTIFTNIGISDYVEVEKINDTKPIALLEDNMKKID